MRLRPIFLAPAIGVILLGSGIGIAQIEGGDRGVAPIDSSSDFEVSGVAVDVSAKDADAARYGGWRLAQRKAWVQLSKRLGAGGGLIADGTLDSLVSGIVVENEQIGPNRYIAKLGVLFDRARASAALGVSNYVSRSAPMVVIPVMWTGGTATVFEQRTPWQEAWARFRTGGSTVDYIRPVGNGADPLLLNYGQTQRPGRGWWRSVLDQYGGSDVLMPTVSLSRQWPGGPIIGVFQARGGPDNRLFGQFALRVGSPAGLGQLLDVGVKRLDDLYQTALNSGALRRDPGLAYVAPVAATAETAAPDDSQPVDGLTVGGTTISVQFDSPGAAAVNGTEAAMRGVPGVSSAATSSLALGGVSVMTITYGGTPDAFRAALQSRGWQVLGNGTTLRIRRAPQLLPPDVAADNATAG
ncbi:heavy-metal-associated domain-containing protein [Sphingomonas sp. TX0543]|uniref:heavy-metal-associated domain-containing protein n=1 Tax=unclassified Sphingomonas TaxID=196159 RepID=UPI0010F4DBED|nr:heavy-metal-associated domain-containing protein [Sphingomonas sp. 3P27F8]